MATMLGSIIFFDANFQKEAFYQVSVKKRALDSSKHYIKWYRIEQKSKLVRLAKKFTLQNRILNRQLCTTTS